MGISTVGAGEGLEFLDELLAPLQERLKGLQEDFKKLVKEGKSTSEISKEIRDLQANMVELATAGVPPATAAIEDFSSSSAKLKETIRDIVAGVKGFENFKAAVQGLGTEGAAAVQALIETFLTLSTQQQASAADAENFRQQLVAVFRDGGDSSRQFAEQLEQAASSSQGSTDSIRRGLEEMVAGFQPAEQAAGKTAAEVQNLAGAGEDGALKISNLADAAEEADVNLTELGEDAEESRIKITNMGEDAAAAGEGVQILETASAGAAVSVGDLADEAERVSAAAEVPEDAIESIRTLGQVSSETAPLVEPLVEPLEAISAAVKLLGETIPSLPEPLASIVESIVSLVEGEFLKTTGEGFRALADAAAPLAEDLPVVALEMKAFVDTAATSEEPLNTLHGGLTRISAEDLVARLLSTAESLAGIRRELEALASDNGGFSQAAAKAEDFKATIVQLEEEMDEFITFITNDFARALLDHATDWNPPIDAAKLYKRTIDDIAKNSLPAFGEAGAAAMAKVDARAEAALRTVNQLNEALQKALDLSDQLDDARG